jgi:NADPH:quinone reductase-like Zn-dependent oxidoreductase
MQAIVYHNYGSPDVLQLKENEKPTAGQDDVLIKVRAASVNPLDCGELHGVPFIFRLALGLKNPTAAQPLRPGVDVAGVVEAVGSKVTRFHSGDAVFGVCISDPQASGTKVWLHRQGSFAEYVCAPESMLATKPDNVTFEQAASAPIAAFTALQGLRDKGQIHSGQKVLINGAAGGVGTFAVQIAKSFGADVTGVCSTRNVDMVRSLGADHVIDYTQEDFINRREQYDLLFDCVGNHSLSECRRAMTPHGKCIMVGDLSGRGGIGLISRLITALLLSRFTSRKFVFFLARPKKEDLELMRDLMMEEKLKPVLDRCYGLSEVPAAIRYVGEKHARGKVVITLDNRP